MALGLKVFFLVYLRFRRLWQTDSRTEQESLMSRYLLAGLMLIITAAATAEVRTQAFLPESGFYYNPQQPGRGYAIEVQDRSLFM